MKVAEEAKTRAEQERVRVLFEASMFYNCKYTLSMHKNVIKLFIYHECIQKLNEAQIIQNPVKKTVFADAKVRSCANKCISHLYATKNFKSP